MGLLERVNDATPASATRAFNWPYPPDNYASFTYGGQMYFGPVSSTVAQKDREGPRPGFTGIADIFKSNPIVFASELKRVSVFSEARFLWRGFNKGRPGNLFSDDSLQILEAPWPRGTTPDLLSEILMYADNGGNAFITRQRDGGVDRLRVMRPDWVTIVMGDSSGRPVESTSQLDAEIIGFIYNPGDGSTPPEALTADEVAHWVPPGMRDPTARFRGMSWITPLVREIQSDMAATMHKLMYFENGGSPAVVVTFNDPMITPENFEAFVKKMEDKHAGWRNAYKTLYLGSGADVHVVGRDLRQLDFNNVQGRIETRIAGASGIHPVLVPVAEALGGSALNAGNFESARRSTADMLFRPLWRSLCGALQTIIPPPTSSSELWYDEAFIPFLRQDAQTAAQITQTKAATIAGLVKEGFTPESAIKAVEAQDMTLLEHTGLVSVQLLPPPAALPTQADPTGTPPATNGTAPSQSAPPPVAAPARP